ncbi:MAG TPA: glycoside hydrolase family 9 protein [Polyangiaceae bacterium]|nr:glycoside hydrolase family 9 protein [Polyangiaceae bacterium]
MFRLTFPQSSILALLTLCAASVACHSSRSDAGPVHGTESGGTTESGGSGAGADSVASGGSNPAGGHAAATAGSPGGIAGAAPIPSVAATPFIVVDQFGYLPDAEKIAVVRDPQTGFDAADSFSPGPSYSLVDARTGQAAFSAPVTSWNDGATDNSSGDKAWWFDFSQVTAPGTYYVLDSERGVRSDLFEISESVYREVLKRAVRSFFYQRVGQAKDAKWAGAQWADAASHVGPGQDHECRAFSAKDDASSAKDLWGGWFDAGDFNKYTNWTASYVVALLRAYVENKAAWGDDYEIPESGNGIPDVLDEAKWGLDYLSRLQNSDGSVLSIVGEASASPPSSAKDPSYYGPASTSATLSTAGAYALGASVLGSLGKAELGAYVNDLQSRALKAWTWADANPNVVFKNNDSASGSAGLGSGQQETDDYGRSMMKLESAVYLYQLTKDAKYRDYFDAHYASAHLIANNNFAYPFEAATQSALLYYTSLEGATDAVRSAISKSYAAGMNSDGNFKAHDGKVDPYFAYMKDYTWGSNATKSNQGSMFYDMVTFGVDPSKDDDSRRLAARYVHYLHGVNPLSFVYLSNMFDYGAARGVTTFFHTWFAHGSALWEKVGVSKYGPPPGYLTGGPNPSYSVDGCCPSGCSGLSCDSEPLSPPKNQPAQKSYKDFNTSWPINSWSVTENSCGYQVAYIRLLSKFVKAN